MDATTASALIAAGSALAGVLFSQLFSIVQWFFEKRHQRKVLLREKLEELAGNLHQTMRWVDEWLNRMPVHGSPSKSPAPSEPSPHSSEEARRVYVLSLLYFPHLREESQCVVAALNTLYGAETAVKPDDEAITQAVQNFVKAKKALDELIEAEARKIT